MKGLSKVEATVIIVALVLIFYGAAFVFNWLERNLSTGILVFLTIAVVVGAIMVAIRR